MSSSAPVIKVDGVSKCFHMYRGKAERIRQIGVRIKRLFGIKAQNRYREFWALDGIQFEIGAGQSDDWRKALERRLQIARRQA